MGWQVGSGGSVASSDGANASVLVTGNCSFTAIYRGWASSVAGGVVALDLFLGAIACGEAGALVALFARRKGGPLASGARTSGSTADQKEHRSNDNRNEANEE